MSGWSLATAAAFGALSLAIDQSPAIEVKAEPLQRTARAERSAQQRVTVSFTNATVREVLDWLSKNDVSFVAAENELARDARITLSVKNRPIDDVADAIAEGLGGHWQDRNGIKVFRKGMGMFPRAFTVPGVPAVPGPFMKREDGTFMFEGPEGMKQFRFEGKPGEPGHFRFEGPDGMKEFKMELGKPGEPRLFKFEGPEGVRELRIDGKDGEPKVLRFKGPEGMKEFKLDGKDGKVFEWQGPEGEKIRAKIHKEMAELHKELPKIKLEMERAHKEMRTGMTDADRAKIEVEVEAAMKEAHKAIEKARKEHPEAFEKRVFVHPGDGEARAFTFETRPGQEMRMRAPMIPHEPLIMGARDGGVDKLVASLSPTQQEKHRRQGYLKASDLTPRQKELLGFKSLQGKWTIKYSKDNKEVVIKSDD